jgi:rubrerythrin
VSELRITRASLLAMGAAAGGGALLGAPVARAQVVKADLDILNYVLTLQYVESALYRDALKQITALDEDVRRLLEQLRDDEVAHVDALRATVSEAGGKPRDRPRVDFGDALATQTTFLKLANTIEDTAVSALNGAAPNFASEDYVAAFASIAQAEARHSALVRLARDKPPAPLPLDKASIQGSVQQAIGPYTVD